MSIATKRKEAWFTAGADAVAKNWPHLGSNYICPLCRRAFSRRALETGDLTEEHVPPEAVKGKPLILTCRVCNNLSGAQLDHHTLKYEQMLDFGNGTLEDPARIALRIGDHVLQSELQALDDNILIHGLPAPRGNRPDTAQLIHAELQQRVDQGTWEGSNFTISFRHGFDPRAVRISWLRSAYLVAFAALGYRYAFSQELAPVRSQLESPDSDVIPIYRAIDPNVEKNRRRLLLVTRPKSLYLSLLVQLGRHSVLLPGFAAGLDFYDRLNEFMSKDEPTSVQMSGSEFPWPNGPQHRLDTLWEV